MSFESAKKIADAVLYEGYVLYPYRASARKNRIRWQFGVLAPRAWSEGGGCEEWALQTECLLECSEADAHEIVGKVRFLQVQQRSIESAGEADDTRAGEGFRRVESLEADGRLWTAWDEGVEREVDFALQVLGGGRGLPERELPFEFPGGEEIEPIADSSGRVVGRAVRSRQPISGVLRLTLEPSADRKPLEKLRVRVENLTKSEVGSADRDEALRSSLIGVHTLLAVRGAAFISLLEPPEWASAAAAICENVRAWPVLLGVRGEREIVLSSPIILYDYPEIAPQSPGDLFDATEIDEILTLRTMALTDEEKREARATDPRAAAIIDRVDAMPPEMLERLHGTVLPVEDAARHPDSRIPREAATSHGGTCSGPSGVESPPWWDPGADASVSPETDSVQVGDVAVSRGSRVLLRPGTRRSDAQDIFLAGRTARVEAVLFDVDGNNYLAVLLEDDPASEFFQWHGRYMYFAPDEVEPLEARR